MSDAGFVIGVLLATLIPGALAGWLVRQWVARRWGSAWIIVAAVGAAWLGMGAFLSFAFADFSVAMD